MNMLSTLQRTFKELFDRDEIIQLARETGATKRMREIHPLDFSLSVTACAIGDEERTIASARRLFSRITEYTPEESSFYNRFNAGEVVLMNRLFSNALKAATKEKRTALEDILGGSGIIDMLAADATQIILPKSARDIFPSTDENHGGVKVTTILSILFQQVKDISISKARDHDIKCLRLPRRLRRVLMVFDLGYFAHSKFNEISNKGGYFICRLKDISFPKIAAIRSGLGQRHLGSTLDGSLPYRGIVDVDAGFNVSGLGERIFRVIRVPVERANQNGGMEVEYLWFVTNLPPESFNVESIATLYRLRWEIEQLFRTLKTVARMDQLNSANPAVILTFIYAALLGIVLTHDICAQMRRLIPEIEPSQYRVFALLLSYLPDIVLSMGTNRYRDILKSFEQSLWREGVNPNPGRKYAATNYPLTIRKIA